jgi:hypothetical protein
MLIEKLIGDAERRRSFRGTAQHHARDRGDDAAHAACPSGVSKIDQLSNPSTSSSGSTWTGSLSDVRATSPSQHPQDGRADVTLRERPLRGNPRPRPQPGSLASDVPQRRLLVRVQHQPQSASGRGGLLPFRPQAFRPRPCTSVRGARRCRNGADQMPRRLRSQQGIRNNHSAAYAGSVRRRSRRPPPGGASGG